MKIYFSDRHKWSGKNNGKGGRDGGLVVSCLKCGMVKQYVGGFPTYFLNDNVYDKKAPKCSNIMEYVEPESKHRDFI